MAGGIIALVILVLVAVMSVSSVAQTKQVTVPLPPPPAGIENLVEAVSLHDRQARVEGRYDNAQYSDYISAEEARATAGIPPKDPTPTRLPATATPVPPPPPTIIIVVVATPVQAAQVAPNNPVPVSQTTSAWCTVGNSSTRQNMSVNGDRISVPSNINDQLKVSGGHCDVSFDSQRTFNINSVAGKLAIDGVSIGNNVGGPLNGKKGMFFQVDYAPSTNSNGVELTGINPPA